MIPFRGAKGRKPKNDQQAKAVGIALRKTFDSIEQEENAELERLIGKMKDFEGSDVGEDQ